MKKTCISRSTLFASFCLISCVCAFSKNMQDAVLRESSILSDSIIHSQGLAIEIYKIRSNKKYLLPKNKLVRIYCFSQKGRTGLKQARITGITDHQITFTPTNKKFNAVTYSEATLSYIEFTTAGTVVRGLIVNTIIICVVVTVTAIIILGSILTGTNPHLGRGSGRFLGSILDDFHKHIRVHKSNGSQKWGIRTIEGAPQSIF